ncbi:MAG: MFS transporter [Gammaproteobacteria bacterium]|nr:MAG: MFS transporter [Gammaproteobacteria bacterium]
MTSNIESNIVKLYIVKLSKWFMLFMPIIWLFYAENGLSISDLLIIQSIYSITIATIEIPSGYVADVLGRRKALIMGTFCGVIGMIIYSMSYTFAGFLAAALCLGIGQSFISGSDTAIMYDTLLSLKRSKEFIKIEGRTISLGNFAEALAFILGGLLAEISLRTPFYIQIGIALIGFIAATQLVEPSQHKLKGSVVNPWNNIKKIVIYAMIENKTLRHFIFYSSIIGAATLTMAWFSQPYFMSLGIISTFYFGLIGAILNIAVAIPSLYAHKIEQMIDSKKLLIVFLSCITLGYFIMGSTTHLAGLLVLFVFNITRGVATPVLKDYMNRNIPSEMRATVMSIRSFITRIIFSSTAPFLGYIADVYSIQQSLLLSGMIFLTLGGISLIFLLSNQTTIKTA